MFEKNIKLIPGTYMWYLKRLCGDPKTVLDLGCARGGLISVIMEDDWEITGIDIDKGYLKEAKKSGLFKKLIQGDLIKEAAKLKKAKKKYDLVFCSQVIEHITKKQGEKLLDICDDLAIDRIFFGTPKGFMEQPEKFVQGSKYQMHRSGWEIDDFTMRGYKVYGIGLNLVWSEEGWGRSENKLVRIIGNIISFVLSPVTYYNPKIAAGMLAIKEI